MATLEPGQWQIKQLLLNRVDYLHIITMPMRRICSPNLPLGVYLCGSLLL